MENLIPKPEVKPDLEIDIYKKRIFEADQTKEKIKNEMDKIKIEHEIKKEALSMGMSDINDAIKLCDKSKVIVDPISGQVLNAIEVVCDLRIAKPYLFKNERENKIKVDTGKAQRG